MEAFAVACPLAPDAPRLLSGFCSSSRSFGLGFLQTPPRDDALALLLAFGSAKTWQSDFHRLSNVPCPAHTSALKGARLYARPFERAVSPRSLTSLISTRWPIARAYLCKVTIEGECFEVPDSSRAMAD